MIPAIVINALISLSALFVGAFILTHRRNQGTGYASYIAYGICLILGAITFFAIPQVTNLPIKNGIFIFTCLLVGCMPSFVFSYFLGNATHDQRLPKRIILILAIIPVLILFIFAAQSLLGEMYSAADLQKLAGKPPLDVLGWLIQTYSISLLVASVFLTISPTRYKQKPFKTWSLIAMESAIIVTVVLESLSFTKLAEVLTNYDLLLAGFALIGGSLFFMDQKNPQVILISREELFDSIDDGIIIINSKDMILALNPAAENLFGIPSQRVYGNSVETILTNWSSISNSNDARETEFRGSLNLNQQWHHLSVRIIKLDDERGKVIFLRDITQRKDPDELRQLAREEMFNLLRSFFKTATTSQSSNDFFRDVLFQITYSFHAEGGAICLIDPLPNSKKFKFSLMAKHGSIMEEKTNIISLQEALVSSKWIFGTKEPLVISRDMDNTQFSKTAQLFGNYVVAVIPLLYNDQLMGMLLQARAGENGFSPDEIVRLSVVTEELASFIYSDRKRKSDIALAERHRLAQDLHDSITQKLYGLVTLTEAVKLGLESGTPVDENRMVDKISDNARQALREMRLFLFELEPVDIERDGLVATIQQRLASVEGRSGIQARMLSDNEILLSVEKETEIYYIVEEALNNILKHANAKSVVVKLKQRKDSIFLEIVDNGVGFDSEHVKLGGKGLGNIKERAKRIKGRLKIDSSPEQGTKISLVVPI